MNREEAINIVRNIYQTDKEKRALGFLIPELCESEDERIPKLLHKLLCAEVTAYQFEKHGLTVDSALNWLEKHKKQKEQQPAEWSEHDLTMIDNVLGTYKTLEDTLNLSTGQDRDILESMNFERDWLKSLPKRVSLKSEQEWSEEDEEWMKYFEELLEFAYNRDPHNLGKMCISGKVWLKSLSPQPKQLKESYKEGFQTARHTIALAFMKYCDKIKPNGKMCLSNGECEEIEKAFLVGDWEKIERYFHKYSWKPSEEQMEALRVVLEHEAERMGSSYELSLANSLYEQLKAL